MHPPTPRLTCRSCSMCETQSEGAGQAGPGGREVHSGSIPKAAFIPTSNIKLLCLTYIFSPCTLNLLCGIKNGVRPNRDCGPAGKHKKQGQWKKPTAEKKCNDRGTRGDSGGRGSHTAPHEKGCRLTAASHQHISAGRNPGWTFRANQINTTTVV